MQLLKGGLVRDDWGRARYGTESDLYGADGDVVEF